MSNNKGNRTQIWLDKFEYFTITGRDCKRFLNGITTGNVLDLNNKILKTCLLSPNGILKSILEIKFLENKLEVIIFVGNTNDIKEYFNSIIFPSDDVYLSDIFSINRLQEVDHIYSWRINQPIFFHDDDKEYNLHSKNPNLMNIDDLQFWKISQAIPSLDNEINGKNNPLELGLTDLIDFNKGCYLGQETISKIRNVSSLKQQIRVWTAKDKVFNSKSVNKNIYSNVNEEKLVGYITSFYQLNSSMVIGLAMIKRKYLDSKECFFSDSFGQISINKSIASTFL